jgi:hypothetical protein
VLYFHSSCTLSLSLCIYNLIICIYRYRKSEYLRIPREFRTRDLTVQPLLWSHTHTHTIYVPQVIRKTFWNAVFTKCPLTFKEYHSYTTVSNLYDPLWFHGIFLHDNYCSIYYILCYTLFCIVFVWCIVNIILLCRYLPDCIRTYYNNIKYYVSYIIGNNINFPLVAGNVPFLYVSIYIYIWYLL